MKIRCQKSIFLQFSLAILLLVIADSYAFAWKLPLEVSTVSQDGKKVYNKLVIGVEAGATDGFDNLWDTKALNASSDPENPLVLRAYLKNKLDEREDLSQLWKDVRGSIPAGGSIDWHIAVDSAVAGRPVQISWNIPADLLGKGEVLTLLDDSHAYMEPVQLDVTQTSSYSFETNGDKTRNISLTLTKPLSPNNSGGGSGFGCGMIKPDNQNHNNPWDNAGTLFVLFLPVILLRLMLLTKSRLSIIIRRI